MTIVALALAVVLLTAFAFVESRVAHPLLPLRVVADRVRGGSFLALGITGIALFAVFLFLTSYLQLTKGFSPIETGLAYLPMTAAIVASATLANNILLAKVGPRPLLVTGMTLGALAMVWIAQLDTTSGYAGRVLPGLIVLGIGMGNIFAPGISTATYGVAPTDAGVASATVNTMQQVPRLDRDRVAELHLRERGELVRQGQAAEPAGRRRRRDSWIHRRVLASGGRDRFRRRGGRLADALDHARGRRVARVQGRAPAGRLLAPTRQKPLMTPGRPTLRCQTRSAESAPLQAMT